MKVVWLSKAGLANECYLRNRHVKFLCDGKPSEYWLWLGAPVDPETADKKAAVSAAGSFWQAGLLEALRRGGQKVLGVGHVPRAVWPRGPWRAENQSARLRHEIEGVLVGGYINLPFIRPHSLTRGYWDAVAGIVGEFGIPGVVLSYNLGYWSMAVARRLSRYHGVPWVSILADLDSPDSAWKRYFHYTRDAAGHVFLSWKAFQTCPVRPKLHLDGGVTTLVGDQGGEIDRCEPNQAKVILYAGSFSPWAGLHRLLQAFHMLSRGDVQLFVCGHGPYEHLRSELSADCRIVLKGFISRGQLEQLMVKADVLVNPRDSRLTGNDFNFPSKVLDYLAFCKPVVSTWTGGLSPDYRDLLVVVEPDTAEALAAKLSEVLDWSLERRVAHQRRVADFVRREKLWTHQAERLRDWICTEVQA